MSNAKILKGLALHALMIRLTPTLKASALLAMWKAAIPATAVAARSAINVSTPQPSSLMDLAPVPRARR